MRECDKSMESVREMEGRINGGYNKYIISLQTSTL
jgi:hypothetical protein